MNVLFMEDDDDWADMVALTVERAGGATQRARGVDELLAAAGGNHNVIILDRMIEGDHREGFDVLKTLREREIQTPVLILTHLGGGDQVASGFALGANDYLTKPFDAVELTARLRNLLQQGGAWALPQVMRHSDLEVRVRSRQAYWGNVRLELSKQAFDILHFLLVNQGQVVSRQALWSQIWPGWSPDPRESVIEAALYRVREDLRRARAPTLIHTVRKRGYVLEHRKGAGDHEAG